MFDFNDETFMNWFYFEEDSDSNDMVYWNCEYILDRTNMKLLVAKNQ